MNDTQTGSPSTRTAIMCTRGPPPPHEPQTLSINRDAVKHCETLSCRRANPYSSPRAQHLKSAPRSPSKTESIHSARSTLVYHIPVVDFRGLQSKKGCIRCGLSAAISNVRPVYFTKHPRYTKLSLLKIGTPHIR